MNHPQRRSPLLPILLALTLLAVSPALFPAPPPPDAPADKKPTQPPPPTIPRPIQEKIRAAENRLLNASGKDKVSIMLEIANLYKGRDAAKNFLWLSQAQALNRTLPAPLPENRILMLLGDYYRRESQFQTAIETFKKARDVAEKNRESSDYILSFYELGLLYNGIGRYSESIAYLKTVLDTPEFAAKEPEKHLFAMINQGMNFHYAGDSQSALNSLIQALKIAQKPGHKSTPSTIGNIHTNLGIIYIALKNEPLAMASFEKSRALYESQNDQFGIANTDNNMGLIYMGRNENDKAREYFTRALEGYSKLKYRLAEGIALGNLGEIAENEKKYPEALKYYNRAYNLAVETTDGYGVAYTLKYIASVTRKMGRIKDALRFARQSLDSSVQIGVKELESAACLELTECYAALNDFKQALEHHRRYKKIEDDRYSQNIASRVAELQNRFEFESKETEIKYLKEKERLQAQQLERKNQLLRLYLATGFLTLLFFLAVFWRFHQKKKAQEAIRESEEKFRRLVEWAGDGIVILRDNVLLYANPAFCRMLGYATEELTGRNFSSLILPGYQLYKAGNSNGSADAAALYETILVRNNNTSVNTEIQADSVIFEKSRVDLYIVRDISSRKQAEAERIQRGKLEAIGILAGGIAHDFNNLLSVILGNIDMARRFVEDETPAVNALGKAEKASLKARELALRFLTFSEGGEPIRKPMPVKPLVNDAISLFKADMNISFTLNLPAGLLRLDCDPDQVHQALVDILMNAAEAMNRKGLIAISAENVEIIASGGLPHTPGNYIKIIIKDTGEGIPAEHLPKVFDLYFSTRQRVSQKGLGFGLPIVYSIVKRHKGHIDIASEPGKGTTVTLYLPAV